jgi:hypothetical protein
MSAAPLKELLAAAQRARTAYDWEEAVAFYSRALRSAGRWCAAAQLRLVPVGLAAAGRGHNWASA